MIADRQQLDLIATFRFLDDNGNGISSLAWNTPGIVIEYKKYGSFTGWTPITLVNGSVGIYIPNSFVADASGGIEGLYELGIPNESKVAGHRTLWRFKYASNAYRYDAIDYVAIPSTETSGVTLEFAIPGVSDVFTTASEIYVKEQDRTIVFEANQDVSAIPLVLIFEDGNGVDKFIINDGDMDKTAGDSVTVTLPSTFTAEETSLNWAIRHSVTERVYGQGSISVIYAPYEG